MSVLTQDASLSPTTVTDESEVLGKSTRRHAATEVSFMRGSDQVRQVAWRQPTLARSARSRLLVCCGTFALRRPLFHSYITHISYNTREVATRLCSASSGAPRSSS